MKARTVLRIGFGLSLLLGFWLAGSSSLAAGQVVDGNQGREGETLDLNSLVTRGTFTLVDFWSPYCPPCLKIAPIMAQLAEKRKDLRVVKLNINRPGTKGIDWKSPLAQQYNLKSVPHLVIFDKKGKQLADGQKAFSIFMDWAQKEGLLGQREG